MNKAILVIDMPNCCNECPICASYAESAFSPREYWCTAADNKDVNPDNKPNWCPLQAAQTEQEVWYGDDSSDWDKGYNSCLHEILGSEENYE